MAPYDGDMESYRALITAQGRSERRAAKSAEPTVSKKDKRRAAAQSRAAAADLRKQARRSEALVERLNREKAALEQKLADPQVYDGSSDRLQDLQRQHGTLSTALREAEEAWLEAQAALDG